MLNLCFSFSPLGDSWHWQSIDDSITLPVLPPDGVRQLTHSYDLCLTGEVGQGQDQGQGRITDFC